MLIDVTGRQKIFHGEVEQNELQKLVRVENRISRGARSAAACDHGMLAGLWWVRVAGRRGEGDLAP